MVDFASIHSPYISYLLIYSNRATKCKTLHVLYLAKSTVVLFTLISPSPDAEQQTFVHTCSESRCRSRDALEYSFAIACDKSYPNKTVEIHERELHAHLKRHWSENI